MNEVTRILDAIEQGDPRAAAQLLPLVYDELRRLAAAAGWPRRSRARRSSRRPWSTRRTCAWSARRASGTGTAAATSSPPRPRPCAASWSRTPAASSSLKRGGGRQRLDLDLERPVAVEDSRRADSWPLDEALDRLAADATPQGASWSNSATSPA